MICPKCNKNIEPGASFCQFCGNPLTNTTNTSQVPQQAPTNAVETLVPDSNINTVDAPLPQKPNAPQVIVPPTPDAESTNFTSSNSTPENNQPVNDAPSNVINSIPEVNADTQMTIDATLDRINGVKKESFFKKNKKLVIIIGIILILAIIGGGYLLFFGKSDKEKTLVEKYSDDRPIIIFENSNYGYIDSDGKVLVKPEYDVALEYNGDYTFAYKYSSEYTGDILDKNGKVYKTVGIFDVDVDEEYGNWIIENQLYNINMKKLTNEEDLNLSFVGNGYVFFIKYGEKFGLMNSKGKVLFSLKDEGNILDISASDSSVFAKDDYCVLSYEDKSSIVNCKNGKEIVSYDNSSVYSESAGAFKINFSDSKKDKVIYIYEDKIIFEVDDDSVIVDLEENYVSIDQYTKDDDEEYTYIIIDTGEIVKTAPTYKNGKLKTAWEENYGYDVEPCDDDDNYYYYPRYKIKNGKKEVLSCDYQLQDIPSDELFEYLNMKGISVVLAYKGDKSYLINLKDGKSITTFEDKYADFSNKGPFVFAEEDDKLIIYNIVNNKSITIDYPDSLYSGTNYIQITDKDDKVTYYNSDLEKIYSIN